MIIEVGKKYCMRNGDITEIVERAGDLFLSELSWAYSNEKDGNIIFEYEEHPHDLMEEIQ